MSDIEECFFCGDFVCDDGDGCITDGKVCCGECDTTENYRTWSKKELLEDFEVESFGPLGHVCVTRKSDSRKGSMVFGGSPRVYSQFVEHTE